MKVKSVELETVIGPTSDIPANTLPEVAFVGRSNVGKSSLINTLVNRRSLARTSSKPGKTQTINFYNLNKELYIVDVPGYGYANAPKRETERWGDMVARYFDRSEMLRVIFILTDMRHEATKLDRQMFEWVEYMEYQPIIIATKADKVKPSEKERAIKRIRESLGADRDTIIVPFSSVTGEGRDEILDFLDQVLENEAEVI